MDFIIGLPRTQRVYDSIWVIVDQLTKSVHFLPTHKMDTLDHLTGLYCKEITRLYGIPLGLISIRDLHSLRHFGNFRKTLGVELHFSTTFHLQIDGQSEHIIQNPENLLCACVLYFDGVGRTTCI